MQNEQVYNTNLKCEGCVAAIAENMNKLAGTGNWRVDLDAPNKPIIVKGAVEPSQVQAVFTQAGYTAEML